MANIIVTPNQKGGVGKTSLILNLGFGLIKRGYKILFIDTDPQKNLTFSLTGKDEVGNKTCFELMREQESIENVIVNKENFDYIPASANLSGLDRVQNDMFALEKALKNVSNKYDFILIDTPPNLGSITLNAIVSSSLIVIPTESGAYSMNGIKELNKTLNTVRQATNKEIIVEGILITKFRSRTLTNTEMANVLEKASSYFKTKVFKTRIRDSVIMQEIQCNNKNLFDYAPKSKITNDFDDFINELLKSDNIKLKGSK